MADTQDKVSPAPAPATAPPLETTADIPAGTDSQDPSKAHINIVEHARAAAHKERNMTLRQGIKLYPKAIFWSVLISTCIVMEGYDISLVNNFCMYPMPHGNAIPVPVVRHRAVRVPRVSSYTMTIAIISLIPNSRCISPV